VTAGPAKLPPTRAAQRFMAVRLQPTGRSTKPGGDLISSLGNCACARVLCRPPGAASRPSNRLLTLTLARRHMQLSVGGVNVYP
jgi:hypothetical protein